MTSILTGLGLSVSAGLNAYIPLLALGLISRYTSWVELPQRWEWIGNGWVLIVIGVLLVIELLADKIPVVDHINDLVQTLFRPVSGGVVFSSGAGSQTPADLSPSEYFSDGNWLPFIIGLLIALGIHVTKAAGRSVVNLATGGIGAPLVSAMEDASAVTLSLFAILLPVMVLVFLVVVGTLLIVRWRRRQQRAPAPT